MSRRRAAFARGGTRRGHRHHAVAFRSVDFAVEMHQCYLDLVTAGTACLLFEEAAPGESSAFRFTAVPLAQAVLRRRAERQARRHLRRNEYTIPQLTRFPRTEDRVAAERSGVDVADARIPVIEAVMPSATDMRIWRWPNPGWAAPGATTWRCWRRGASRRRSSTSVG